MVKKSPSKSANSFLKHLDGNGLHNTLLLNLPARECEAVYSQLVFMPLRIHDVLNEAGEPIKYVYFMNSGLASVLNVMEDGKSVEVGLTGKEGFVGLPLLVGFRSSPSRVIVQIEGSAFRLSAANLVALLRTCRTLEKRLHRYAQVLAMQASQVAACNRLHEVDERLARWLLMSQDRIHADSFHVTHEFLAAMLGVRREGITTAASALQRSGLIAYRRGNLTVLDRQGLEAAACGCYAAEREAYAALLC